MLEIVSHYAKANAPASLPELKKAFPDNLQPGALCVVESLAAANVSNFKGHRRYYLDEPIDLPDGPAVVCDQWRKNNIAPFIARAEELGYTISSTGL